MSLTIPTIPCGSYQANAFLVFMQDRDDCILVDPGDDLQALKDAVARSGKKLSAILLTHGHFDHILAASPLAKETGAQVYVHEGDMEMLNDIRLNAYMPGAAVLPAPKDIIAEEYDDVLDVAGMHFEIVHTPGHSKGSVCIYLPDDKTMFSGDLI